MRAITITAVGSETFDSAASLLVRFFQEEGFTTPPDHIKANLITMLGDGSCWAGLASIDGAVVGVVTVTTMLYVEWGRLGEIGDLYVIPEYRGSGVARALIDASQMWCREKECSAVSVVITEDGDARRQLSKFYEAHNFQRTGRMIMMRVG